MTDRSPNPLSAGPKPTPNTLSIPPSKTLDLPRVALLGSANNSTAYTMVNQQWLDHLRRLRKLPFTLSHHTEENRLPPKGRALIWHHWQQDFLSFGRPEGFDAAIAVRTWDFGPYPESWATKLSREFQRLWVHCEWVKEKALESGISEEMVDVIPLGVDPLSFQPNGNTYHFSGSSEFRLLFVGGSVQRKGVDLLTKAFATEFAPDEGVTLVIKDRPMDTFYQGLDSTNLFKCLDKHKAAGSFVHLRVQLCVEELASLYRSCDVGVFPYRAEGFALPILEAMACGLPTVVPRFGACLDYCDETTCFFTPHRRIRLPTRRNMAYNTLGFSVEIEEVDFCEVSLEGLRSTLRSIVTAGRAALGERRAACIARAKGLSWTNSARRIVQALEPLL